jgi:hypothetical protein
LVILGLFQVSNSCGHGLVSLSLEKIDPITFLLQNCERI